MGVAERLARREWGARVGARVVAGWVRAGAENEVHFRLPLLLSLFSVYKAGLESGRGREAGKRGGAANSVATKRGWEAGLQSGARKRGAANHVATKRTGSEVCAHMSVM